MSRKRVIVTLCSFMAVALWITAGWSGPESDPLKPRVPDAERGEARKMKSPITVTPDVLAKGKDLYEGKGTCANCHGQSGEKDVDGFDAVYGVRSSSTIEEAASESDSIMGVAPTDPASLDIARILDTERKATALIR